ncbi:hypothetical protein E4U58_001376 [Claviceps cyperi]|nr:hypothetical protein E4U58_001376 [Claviceps cyperi]
MQLLSAILVAVAVKGAVASLTVMIPAPVGSIWCNHGTAGDGGCEANGLHTYCSQPELLLRSLSNGDDCFEESARKRFLRKRR